MTYQYYLQLSLNHFMPGIPKVSSGKTMEAVLNIEWSKDRKKYDLRLESPSVCSVPSTAVKDLFNRLSPDSVDLLKVFGPTAPDTGWSIEFCKNGQVINNGKIHCRAIHGLPDVAQ